MQFSGIGVNPEAPVTETPTRPPASEALGPLPAQGVLSFQEHRAPPAPLVELAGALLTARPDGALLVKVSCPAAESRCAGTIALRTTVARGGALGGHSKRRRTASVTVALGTFSLAGGNTVSLALRPTAQGRALLARAHILHAIATILAHDPAGATHVTRSAVTIRVPAPAAHRKS